MSDSLYMGLILAGAVISIAGFSLLYTTISETSEDMSVSADSGYTLDVSGTQQQIPVEQFHTACLGADCVPSLHTEQFISGTEADAWLENGDMVIGVTANNTSYAFPLPVMRRHFVVNTYLNESPVVVTYSPYAAVENVFSRTVDREPILFRFTGKLVHGGLVMQDVDTQTQWEQFQGHAITGEHVSKQLEPVQSRVTRWSLWKQNHPNTTVLSRNTSIYDTSAYEDNPFFNYPSSDTVPGPAFTDDSPYRAKDVVYGVTVGDVAKAYREVHVKDMELVQDTVNNKPIMLVQDESTGVIHVFQRTINNTSTTFTYTAERQVLVDDRTGSTWALNGTAINGSMTGTQLTELDATRLYWFSWKRLHPDTQFFQQ